MILPLGPNTPFTGFRTRTWSVNSLNMYILCGKTLGGGGAVIDFQTVHSNNKNVMPPTPLSSGQETHYWYVRTFTCIIVKLASRPQYKHDGHFGEQHILWTVQKAISIEWTAEQNRERH